MSICLPDLTCETTNKAEVERLKKQYYMAAGRDEKGIPILEELEKLTERLDRCIRPHTRIAFPSTLF